MRDCSNNRAGFDRVLMTVAATFITVAAGSTLAGLTVAGLSVAGSTAAHAGPSPMNPADMAIDAAIPRPEPANVPPPTAADFKTDTTASVPAATDKPTADKSASDKPAVTKPADVATAPATDTTKPDTTKPDASKPDTAKAEPASTEPAKTDAAKTDAAKTDAAKTDAAKTDTAVTTPAAAPATPPAATAAAPASEPVKAASNVPAADQPVADKLHEMFGAKSLRYFDRKAERATVEKFYAARDFAPLWTQGGGLTANAKGVIARLKDAASDGMNAADYPVPDFAAATTPDALAEADMKLTDSMLDYARQAQSGRMHYSQVSGDIQYPEHPTDPTEVLTNVTTAKDASLALDSYNPPQKLYRALKAKLAELRGQGDGPVTTIADGPALRYIPGSKRQAEVVVEDPRVPELRAKLGITESADDDHYDAKVAQAVRKYQENADLRVTGVLDEQTVKAINSPKRGKLVDLIEVNMERWRWLPRDLGAAAIGDAYVILNIPDYTLKVMQHGAQVWTTRVVTGKPGIHATPLLTETMKYITVNPTWNVPPSIVYGEYLPALAQDPTVLQRMGLKLDHNPDGSVHISQPPGEANALGRIRFNFPNKFLVYQHDTPDKYLFAKDERAYSHGCMRVQYPDQYAAVLLGITEPNEHYTADKIRSMYGHSEIDLKFPTPVPVNITYQTAFVDDAGKLQTRRDVYGRDSQMIAMLSNTHGRDMENIIAHAQPSIPRPPGGIPAGVNYASDTSSASQPSFFERLFGGPQRAAPAPSNFRRPPGRVVTR